MYSRSDDIFDRLFERTVVKENGCWNYIGATNLGGYGRLKYNGKGTLAHRVAYILCVADIPDNLLVLHTCDNRQCVNPDHLFLGTHKDNMTDMYAKERNPLLKGTNNGRAILDEAKVIEIRKEIAAGIRIAEIAAKYKINRSAIYSIRSGQNWNWVPK